jgi:hypothetical protein
VKKTILAVLFLGACAFPPDYTWYPDPKFPPSPTVEWVKIPYRDLHERCKVTWKTHPRLGACAIQLGDPFYTCYIFSHLTKEEADLTISGDGISLKVHEEMHCKGLRHIQP